MTEPIEQRCRKEETANDTHDQLVLYVLAGKVFLGDSTELLDSLFPSNALPATRVGFG